MTFKIFETVLTLCGVLASIAFIGGAYKSKTNYGKIIYVAFGVLAVVLSLVVWANTEKDPLQVAWCAIDTKAPACAPKPVLVSQPMAVQPVLQPPLSDKIVLKFTATDDGEGAFKFTPANPDHVLQRALLGFTGFLSGWIPLEGETVDLSVPLSMFMDKEMQTCASARSDRVKFFSIDVPLYINTEYLSGGAAKEQAAFYKARIYVEGSQTSGKVVGALKSVVLARHVATDPKNKEVMEEMYRQTQREIAERCAV